MNAFAYARFSSDNQREESIDAQIRAIKEYCAREGITLIRVYADSAKSATTDQRPEFQHMIADAATAGVDCIIVHKLDRFSRDRYDSAYYKRQLKKYGVRLISVLENLSDSPESIILESVLEGMAEYYSKNLAREVMKGMRETAYQCKHTGGKAPLGYDVAADRSYVINPQEAEAVRLIFDMYAAGRGYSEVLDVLNEKGFKTKNGKPFGKNSLYSILSNEKYAGVFVFNKTERKLAGHRNGHKFKDEDEVIRIPGGIPAIVSDTAWERVQTRMAYNKHAQAAYTAKSVYLLSGRIFCGSCGAAMVGKRGRMGRNKAEYSYYECGDRKRKRNCTMKPINKDVVEKLVINTLYENLFSPKALRLAVDKIYKHEQAQRKGIPPYVASAKKRMAELEREIDNVVSAIGRGMYHESMKAKMDELEAEKAAVLIRINEAERQAEVNNRTKEEIASFLSRYSKLKSMEPEVQKSAVELFVYRVTVSDDYIDVDIRPWISPDGSAPEPPESPGPGSGGDGGSSCDGGGGSWDTPGSGPPPPTSPNCKGEKVGTRHGTVQLHQDVPTGTSFETLRVPLESYRHEAKK